MLLHQTADRGHLTKLKDVICLDTDVVFFIYEAI